MTLSGGESITEPMKNALNTLNSRGTPSGWPRPATPGSPSATRSMSPVRTLCGCGTGWWSWGPGPRAWAPGIPLRLEAGLPLYGHELGLSPRRDTIPHLRHPPGPVCRQLLLPEGRLRGPGTLQRQYDAFRKIMDRDFSDLEHLPPMRPIALLGRGVLRAGMPIYRNDEVIGWVTSGTMVPYYFATRGPGPGGRDFGNHCHALHRPGLYRQRRAG